MKRTLATLLCTATLAAATVWVNPSNSAVELPNGTWRVTCPVCKTTFANLPGRSGANGGVTKPVRGKVQTVRNRWMEQTCPKCGAIVVSVWTTISPSR